MKKIVNVSSFACDFVCTFPTAEQAATFTETVLRGDGPIAEGEIAQTAFALGGGVRAVAGVAALYAPADAYADTIPTLRAAPASTLPAPADEGVCFALDEAGL